MILKHKLVNRTSPFRDNGECTLEVWNTLVVSIVIMRLILKILYIISENCRRPVCRIQFVLTGKSFWFEQILDYEEVVSRYLSFKPLCDIPLNFSNHYFLRK